jgi:hypothetical protein
MSSQAQHKHRQSIRQSTLLRTSYTLNRPRSPLIGTPFPAAAAAATAAATLPEPPAPPSGAGGAPGPLPGVEAAERLRSEAERAGGACPPGLGGGLPVGLCTPLGRCSGWLARSTVRPPARMHASPS